MLERHVDSLEKLEIVVVLHHAPAHSVPSNELATRTQLAPQDAAEAIAELARAQLVEVQGGVTRLVLSAEHGAPVTQLVELYDEDRLQVMRAMSQIAVEKIRGMAARAFADAFHLRKKKDDNG